MVQRQDVLGLVTSNIRVAFNRTRRMLILKALFFWIIYVILHTDFRFSINSYHISNSQARKKKSHVNHVIGFLCSEFENVYKICPN